MAQSIRHLHNQEISVERESDHIWFHFCTYQLKHDEWGYELVRADGHSCSTVSDPNWRSEDAVIQAIHEHVGKYEHVPGYGWCVVEPEGKAALRM